MADWLDNDGLGAPVEQPVEQPAPPDQRWVPPSRPPVQGTFVERLDALDAGDAFDAADVLATIRIADQIDASSLATGATMRAYDIIKAKRDGAKLEPAQIRAIDQTGLVSSNVVQIIDQVPLEIAPNPHNRRYLEAKNAHFLGAHLALGRLGEDVQSLDQALQGLPAVVVDAHTADRVRHGVPVPASRIVRWESAVDGDQKPGEPVRIHDIDGSLLAIGRQPQVPQGSFAIEKVLVGQE